MRCGFADVCFGPATRMTIRVKQPETEHTVSVGKLQSWLNGGGKNPSIPFVLSLASTQLS